MMMKILLASFILYHLSLVNYAAVKMTVSKTLVTVREKEARRIKLIDDTDPILCSDSDGDNTRASIVAIIPDKPCGECFALETCEDDTTRYCLLFQPSKGGLDSDKATTYVVSIVCTDDKEPPANGTVLIRLEANHPPVFQPEALGYFETDHLGVTRNKQMGFDVHTVNVTDNENDALYFSMYTSPPTDLFLIGYGSGVIRAKKDLRLLCFSPVSFHVTVWDSFHSPIGPKVIQITFGNRNGRPTIDNTEKTIRIAEDLPVGDSVLTVDYTDTYSEPFVTFEMTADPVGGLDIYRMDGGNVRVRRELDYEYEPLREVTLTIRAFDGFCYSDPYSVKVIITDVNEDFQLSALTAIAILDEGLLTFATNITIWDQDQSDKHRFVRLSGNPALQVEGTTGLVTSKGVVDIEPDETRDVAMKVEISDQAHHTQVLQIDMTLRDINDNKPVFANSVFDFEVDTCTEIGEALGWVGAKDDDSALDGNNKLVFKGGGKSFAVLATGKVIYTALLSVGEVDTGPVYVQDQGLKPGNLEGTPATVSVECKVCPTTTTTTAVVPTDAAPTTKFTVPKSARAKEVLRATDTSTNQRDFASKNVGWIAAAGAVFLLLCVLLTYVIYTVARVYNIADKGIESTQAQPRRPVGRGPDKPNLQQSNQPRSDRGPVDIDQQQPQPQQQQPEPQQQQPQPPPVTKPRAEIAAITMIPPPLPYERVFINGQTPPAGNDVTAKPQDKTQKDADKAQREVDMREQDRRNKKVKAEPEIAKPPAADLPRKPQMQIGEYIDLEVITPRNSPLPYVQ